ncbi:uncharacterized protein EHS24_005166 [Apiotrichum porosum]|uniref:Histone deacetylase n=1 Tax=Apiotrichum porosum TaxID=105984 RepID=A0A427Y727_9TREE|nr:uncharacterized protein EHS24_005166 [Apiotrichum porosum]RSH86888.1 hypothetical protein EHS24_005166 [Apiotrichum porosum]
MSACLVSPEPTLATEAELRRYHDARYVEYLLRDRTEEEDYNASSNSDNDKVPDHVHLEPYAPSFTLEVPESNVPDENTDEGLEQAEAAFTVLAERIRAIVALHT